MQAALATRIETAAGRASAATFSLASGFSAWMLVRLALGAPLAAALSACVCVTAFIGSAYLLARLGKGGAELPLTGFDVQQYAPEPVEELLLTDRYVQVAAESGPLELDDILAELGPDSRVVRLFDRNSMPTPGQLQSRIDAHLNRAAVHDRAPDASQALHEALAELRRSLR